MLEATVVQHSATGPDDPAPDQTPRLTLTFDQRRKSRYRTRTDCGRELGWFLPRGRVLGDGDCLVCTDGTVVRVCAAAEEVSEVTCADTLLISRAAYHLGNRHVPLDIASGRLRYQRDSVLDNMLIGLGLGVRHARAPFNPENGAYHGQAVPGHAHSHSHDHQHGHGDAADHGHTHDHH